MDLVVVTYGPDLKLLRHFLASYEQYYETKDRIYVLTSLQDEPVLREMDLPGNAQLVFREDFPDLVGATSYSQQTYLKLIAHGIVDTEYFCIMDSDFLFVRPIRDEHFFSGNKPLWFCRPWLENDESLRWKPDTERLIGSAIAYNYGDVPQWVFKRSLLRELCERIDARSVLNTNTVWEFLLYGWYIHTYHADEYVFITDDRTTVPMVEKINQIPPTYCHLDPTVHYRQYPSARYVVFWSHWDLAESKMVEFFEDSQVDNFGRVLRPAARTPLPIVVTSESIAAQEFGRVEGIFTDGWLHERAMLGLIVPSNAEAVDLSLMIPGRPDGLRWELDFSGSMVGGTEAKAVLGPGLQHVQIPLHADGRARYRSLDLRLGRGFKLRNSSEERELRARLVGLNFVFPE